MRNVLQQRSAVIAHVATLILAGILLLAPVHAQGSTEFVVTVEEKTSEHPFPNQGFSEAYAIGGEQGKTLTLTRGVTYTFQMQNVPSIHPFYITTSIVGAGEEPYSQGVDGNGAIDNETLTFTPPESAPDTLYYNCQNHQYMGGTLVIEDATDTAIEERNEVPGRFELEQNYPNPFNPSTTIRFEMTESAHISLVIYDETGREVKRLVDGIRAPGTYVVEWDGTDTSGRHVASGTYVYRLEGGKVGDAKMMTLLR